MEEVALKKSIGYWTALALSIGSIAGTTLFFGHATGVALSGTVFAVGLIVLGVLSIYISTLFAELVSMFPTTGGAYEFTKQAYNRFFSFIIGWTAWIVGSFSIVIVIVGTVTAFLPFLDTSTSIALSIGLILLLNLIAYIGMAAGGIVLILLSAIFIGALIFASIAGFLSFEPTHFMPLLTHPLASIWLVLFFIIEAYFGWEGAAYLAEETKNATKVIPKAIIHGTIVVAVLSIVSGIAFLGVFGWMEGSTIANPLGAIVGIQFGGAAITAFNVLVFLALFGTAVSAVLGMPRLLLALARDRLFLGQVKQIHPRFNTPHKAILFQTVVLIIFFFIGFANYTQVLNLLVPLGLFMYVALILAVPLLRFRKPQLARAFRAPFGKVGPVLIVIIFAVMVGIWLTSQTNAPALFRLSLSLIGFGLPIYLLVESYYNPQAITKLNDLFANFIIPVEQALTKKEFRKNIATFLGDVDGKTLLEIGCSNPVTTWLRASVGPTGKVYVIHFSEKQLSIIRKHTEKRAWETESTVFGQLIPVKDMQYYKRIHPSIGRVDGMVSVGMLGYIQDMEGVLKNLREKIPVGGRIVFAEYTNFFHILPEVEWLGNPKKIEALFRKNGFSVRIVKKRRLFWNTIYLYGIRYPNDVAFI